MLEINAKEEMVNRIIEKLIKLDEIRRKKQSGQQKQSHKKGTNDED